MKYYVESYGCTLNQGETEMFADTFSDGKNERVDSPSVADLAVIGTCVVIRKTEERMKRRIRDLKNKCDEIVITGCLTTTDIEEFEKEDNIRVITPSEIHMTQTCSSSLMGILPISSGCVGNCSYCITKLARGELESRDPEQIMKRFKSLLESGNKEIKLTCQDTASYGLDIGTSFPDLLDRLLSKEGEYKIRIGMMNPDTALPILDEIIDKMRDDRIYKFLHLPLQSGSNRILKKMNRNYTVKEWMTIVDCFRESFPDLTLSTDIIAGFPGETVEDFEDTKKIIKNVKPDIVNVTRFSPRPGTKADSMENQIHSRKKKKRSKELSNLRLKISRDINKRYVGRTEEVLVLEEGKDDTLKARMDNYKVVIIKNNEKKLLGEKVKVEIVSAEDVYLVGKLI